MTASVVVDRASVGNVRLAFATGGGNQTRDVAWWWIAVAAVLALLIALLASWVVTRLITRPIAAMTSATQAFTAGDRQARAGVHGPGEIGELARAFDLMADTVARSERDRRNLTADVAHELRTPLAALQAGLEELRDGLVEPTPRGWPVCTNSRCGLGTWSVTWQSFPPWRPAVFRFNGPRWTWPRSPATSWRCANPSCGLRD